MIKLLALHIIQRIHIETSWFLENRDQVLAQLSEVGAASDPITLGLANDLYERCVKLVRPQAAVCRLNAQEAERGQIKAGDVLFHVGNRISASLRKASEYAFFMATIGPGPEELAREMMSIGDYPEGYTVDLLASSLAETLAELVHEQVIRMAETSGLKASNRYSPGYCGWKVDEQTGLFSLFGQDRCDIQLSESCLMHPIKSVSGVIGIGPNITFSEHSCELCGIKDCPYRRVKSD